MVEGKNYSQELGQPEFDSSGKIGLLLLCLMKSIQNNAHYVVLHLGLYVLSFMVALQKIGVFVVALINKVSILAKSCCR